MMIFQELLGQELIYEQFSTIAPEPLPPQTILDPGGAITGLSSNTLVIGGKVGTVQAVELPQPLGTGANPTFNNATFNSINTVDDATSRSNLGLGGLATQSAGAAVANLSQTISNPPTQAEVSNIQNKVNELLNSLRAAGIIAT
jgi:hypothetical protein